MRVNWYETNLGKSVLKQAAEAAAAKSEAPADRAGAPALSRMYSNAIPNRFSSHVLGANSSADAELKSSLRALRGRSRSLVRDAGYAKNAKRVVINNVVGTGIRMQAAVKTERGTFNGRINTAIENAWRQWMRASSCHTGGALHFHDLERLLVGQVFEAGEIFLRIHRRPFGDSKVPFALEVVEPERIVDGYALPAELAPRAVVRMGIEVDDFQRPIAYWIRQLHPGDIRPNAERTDRAERVPAEDVIHLRIVDRWPQTRGEPWLHAAAAKLEDMNGYSEAEIIAARGAANYLGTIETPEAPTAFARQQPDGSFQASLEPGTMMRLLPGEKFGFVTPNRPNAALDPFMRFMLREVAAATGISYESLSRDYSQSSYSSSRLALLDDRDVWRALQLWFIRGFRERLHREWLQAAVLAGAVEGVDLLAYGTSIDKFEAVNFRPRGWSWVDPTKEVTAYKEAVKAGFTTVEAVIAQTGGGDNLEDTLEARADELEYMDELELAFDTSPAVYVPAESRGQMIVDPDTGEVVPAAVYAAQNAPAPAGTPGAPATAAPAPAPAKAPLDPENVEEPGDAEGDDDERAARVVGFRRHFPRR